MHEDNLIELRKRMEENPEIPVTLTEGCCMVCDPCNVYHAGEHLCYHAHIKNTLRDLMILERLGVPPGATMTRPRTLRPCLRAHRLTQRSLRLARRLRHCTVLESV